MSSRSVAAVKPVSESTRRRVEAGIRDLSDPGSDTRKRYDAAGEKWDKLLKPLNDAFAVSERLTERDLGIVIGA